MDIREAIELLRKTRATEADFTAQVAEIKAELEALPLWKMLQDVQGYLATARADVETQEHRVRWEALEAYNKTGNKKPHPAVAIKMYAVLYYASLDAHAYACQHLPKALRLDVKAFEKVAKVANLDFVTISEEPRATIARDLSAY